MLFTRSLGSFVLGKPTLTQLGLTCVLATLWGFMPGFSVAPLSILLLLALLLVLQANLALGVIVAGVARLLALLLMPLSFKLGVFLVEGPLSGLFSGLINGSGTALLGFDFYVTSGSWLIGLVVGSVIAWLVTSQVRKLRLLLVDLEVDSERYQEIVAKGWVRSLGKLILGADLRELKPRFEQKGSPIRIAGVAVVVLVGIGAFFATPLLEAFCARQMKSGLEQANGATVDVGNMALSFGESRLIIENLAMADPEMLTHDRFRASRVEVDLSVSELLRRRLVLDRVEATGCELGSPRQAAGQRVGKQAEPSEPIELPEYEDLEQYWGKAKALKARLEQARQFLEDISGYLPEQEENDGASFEEWLAREVAQKGYEFVRALHMLEGSPALLVRHFKAHEVKNPYLNDELLAIDAHNLSTHPQMAEGVPRLSLKSSGNTLDLDITLNEAAKQPQPSQLAFHYRGIPTERITAQLKESADYLSGGTVDLALEGAFRAGGGSYMELPLQASLRDVTLSLPKVDPVVLNNFPVTVLLKGPLDNPRVKFDHKAFIAALRKEGFDAVVDSYKQQAREEVQARVDEEKGKLEGKAKEKLGEELGGLLGDQSKEGEVKEGEQKPKLDVGGLLGGLSKKKETKKDEDSEQNP